MKKILKSELTPQLVKHEEATLQLFNIQGGIFHNSLLADVSVPEIIQTRFSTLLIRHFFRS